MTDKVTPEWNRLRQQLENLDGRSYGAYKQIAGSYDAGKFRLRIDHVQGDPFGTPSRLRVQVPETVAGFPAELSRTRIRAMALRDYLCRTFAREAAARSRDLGSGSSGRIFMEAPGQQVLERSAVVLLNECIEARFRVGLPARGRRILGRAAAELLCEVLPGLVESALRYASMSPELIRQHVEVVEDAESLRAGLVAQGLVAFVADGAVLPRRTGADDRPLENAVPFTSPDSLRVTLHRPNAGPVTGMGVRQGITLIVGGGYHGKTTLLEALELGVYNHVPGDGRELVVADPTAVKIRAEDGRSVAGVDISSFISQLPQGLATDQFTTSNASGSTSQAANIVEALEAGARVLLIDEDTSASNFMVRDRRMQQLIAKSREPITPFVDRVRQLDAEHGVSTVLVLGGSGDYLDQADTVVGLNSFQAEDLTSAAREVAQRLPTGRASEASGAFGAIRPRTVALHEVPLARAGKPRKIKVQATRLLQVGTQSIDLTAVAQLIETAQSRAIGRAILLLAEWSRQEPRTLLELLTALEDQLDGQGLDLLTEFPEDGYAAFRRFELAAAINRLRDVPVARAEPGRRSS